MGRDLPCFFAEWHGRELFENGSHFCARVALVATSGDWAPDHRCKTRQRWGVTRARILRGASMGKRKLYLGESEADARARRYALRGLLLDRAKDCPCIDCGRSFPPEAMVLCDSSGDALTIANLRGLSLERLSRLLEESSARCAACDRVLRHALARSVHP